MRKLASTIALAALLAFTLTACSHTPAAKTENQISADICAEDSYFSDYNLKIDSFKITKRQTNTDAKSDYIWCDVVGSNNVFAYSASYELTYILYNNGWLLEDYLRKDSSIIPLAFPTEAEAIAALDNHYSGCTCLGNSQHDNSITYQFAWKDEYNYLITNYDISLTYSFSPASGWTGKVTNKEVTGYSFDILGEWEYMDNERNFYINVIEVGEVSSMESKDVGIVLSYALKNQHRGSHHPIESVSSNGPINANMVFVGRESRPLWIISTNYTGAKDSIDLYLGSDASLYDWDTGENDDGYGIAYNARFLVKRPN